MAFTYVLTNDIGKVRFLIGDNIAADAFLADDEITYLLTLHPNVRSASVEACKAIAARMSREADKSIGDLSLSYSQRATAYLTLAKELQASAAGVISAYCGGISISDKLAVEADTDRVPPRFSTGMMSDSGSDEVE